MITLTGWMSHTARTYHARAMAERLADSGFEWQLPPHFVSNNDEEVPKGRGPIRDTYCQDVRPTKYCSEVTPTKTSSAKMKGDLNEIDIDIAVGVGQ